MQTNYYQSVMMQSRSVRVQILSGCTTLFLLLITSITLWAQQSKYPLYLDQSLPKPPGLGEFSEKDFSLDINRTDLYPDGFLYGDQATLKRLGDFLISDPEGITMWSDITASTAAILNQWDFIRREAGRGYIYHVSQLQDLAIVYIFTGHRGLGQFIKGHLMQIAELPKAFWLHAELRESNYENNKGSLETSYVCTALSVTLSATPDLFSVSEKSKVETALREKGLQPCLNWLQSPKLNNWTAVVSTGAYAAARYFNDEPGMQTARDAMVGFLAGSIEEDGSYGEGMGYFNYPINSLLPALLCMSPDDRMAAFASSSIARSPIWRVYPFLYAVDPEGNSLPTILHFGDSNYQGPSSPATHILLTSISRDPLATWLMERYAAPPDIREKLLLFSLTEPFPKPQSPEERGLPLLKVFDNGDCFMRSDWRDNGIVLAMRSGDGSRVKFSHQRPELGSIALGAFGEYMIVSSGSASYRSPIHYQWDGTTRAANVVTIDDQNQLFPGSGRGSWNSTDVSGFWQSGTPKAEIVESRKGKLADLLVNDLAGAYHIPLKNFKRSVLFVKDPGYFVVVDRIDAVESTHKYSWRIHLNNRDGEGRLVSQTAGEWHFSRPQADLGIRLYADQPMETTIGEGYMHGPGRDYSPGGKYEGKPGSSIEMEAYNRDKCTAITYVALLYPLKKGDNVPMTHYAGGNLTVGADRFILSEGECRMIRGDEVETFQLW